MITFITVSFWYVLSTSGLSYKANKQGVYSKKFTIDAVRWWFWIQKGFSISICKSAFLLKICCTSYLWTVSLPKNLRNFDLREAVENTVESTRLKITSFSLDFVNKFTLSMRMVTWNALKRSNFISHLSERLWISLIERKKFVKLNVINVNPNTQSLLLLYKLVIFFHRSTCTIERLEEVYIFLGATVMRGTMRVFIKSVKYARSDDKYTLCTLR